MDLRNAFLVRKRALAAQDAAPAKRRREAPPPVARRLFASPPEPAEDVVTIDSLAAVADIAAVADVVAVEEPKIATRAETALLRSPAASPKRAPPSPAPRAPPSPKRAPPSPKRAPPSPAGSPARPVALPAPRFTAVAATAPLPQTYAMLDKVFGALETVCSITHMRGEACIFDKMKKSIEYTCKRTICRAHLAQIRTVYPEAYEYHAVPFTMRDTNLQSSILLKPTVELGSTTATLEGRHPGVVRQEEFRHRLLNRVKEHHDAFVTTLPTPPAVPVPLQQWHPDFDLDDVPPIPEAELPEMALLTTTTALQLLQSRETSRLPAAIAASLAKVAAAAAEPAPTSAPAPAPAPEAKVDGKPQKMSAVTLALLERVRARERQQAQEHMAGQTPAQRERALRVARLPTLVDSIQFIYSSHARDALYEHNIAAKLASSYHVPIGPEEMRAHLHLLAELLPSWCSLVRSDHGVLFKIDRSTNVNEVKTALHAASTR